jgi:hypothetical protein
MLFRALTNRMRRRNAGSAVGFGDISGSEASFRISFEKYPDLLSLLSQLLQSPALVEVGENIVHQKQTWKFSMTTERVFPALELIGEKIPSLSGQDDQILRELVYRHFGSPVWGIRDRAARTYASLLSYSEILSTVENLSNSETLITDQNHLHGIALCVRYALQRIWASYDRCWRGDECSRTSPHLPGLISRRPLCGHTSRY